MDIQELFKMGMDREVPQLLDIPLMEGECLNIGAGNKHFDFATSLDLPEWDADSQQIPRADESVASIIAFHFLEHVREPVKLLQEFQRVLMPGGVVNIVVPYYSSAMAAQDLDHKHFFTEETWKTLFRNPYYNKNRVEWKFEVKLNLIIGVVERNLCLMTELQKTPRGTWGAE